MRGRAQRDDRPARFGVVDNVFHLLVGQLAKAQEEHHQVRRVEGIEPRDIVERHRVDLAVVLLIAKSTVHLNP